MIIRHRGLRGLCCLATLPPRRPLTRKFQAARARAASTSNETESWLKQRMHCKQLPLPCPAAVCGVRVSLMVTPRQELFHDSPELPSGSLCEKHEAVKSAFIADTM